jgi:hypothetical protein
MWHLLTVRIKSGPPQKMARNLLSERAELDYTICVDSISKLPLFVTPGAAAMFLDLGIGPCRIHFKEVKKIVVGYYDATILEEFEIVKFLTISGETAIFNYGIYPNLVCTV